MARKLSQRQQLRIQKNREEQMQDDTNLRLLGRVITQHGTHILIEDAQQQDHLAYLRQNLGKIVTGDWVYYQQHHDEIVIVDRLPRQSLLTRIGFGGKEKLVASNIDQVMIVIASEPAPSPSLIDRYLVAIEHLALPAIILVNKADLTMSSTLSLVVSELSDIGYPIIYYSQFQAETRSGLLQVLDDKTSIFVGQSGVGKSSLVNQLIPDVSLRTTAINEKTGLGNHTTSASTLYRLPAGGMIIDSPGVRSFELDQVNGEILQKGFIELFPYFGQCKFSDCRHLQDPGCAFVAAIADQKISRRRVQSYLQMRASIKE